MKSLCKAMGRIEKESAGRIIYLFLDFDGTLSPIASSPRKAVLPENVRMILFSLSRMRNVKVAIVTGRAMKDIKRMVGIKNITYAANHGFQICGPLGKFSCEITKCAGAAMRDIRVSLKKHISGIKKVLVEDKGTTISVHFRQVHRNGTIFIRRKVSEITRPYVSQGSIKVLSGKKILEIGPEGGFDKGAAVLWLLLRQKRAAGKPILPIYIGDDVTDEDAFYVLKHEGITVRIGRNKHSHAVYYLNGTKDVKIFLEWLTNLKKERSDG